MKYKLINTATKEEHLCDKVVIKGFDYYVSDELPSVGNKSILQVEGFPPMILTHFEECESDYEGKKVIACNNPNIDIPKVVDEVEVLAIENSTSKIPTDIFPDASEQRRWNFEGFIDGYNKSQETHPFSMKDMIQFNEWYYNVFLDDIIGLNGKEKMDKYQHLKNKGITEEVIQLWKSQQPKTAYYEI